MRRGLLLAMVSCAAMTMAMAAPAFAEDVTLNAIFMKQAGYSEEDVTAIILNLKDLVLKIDEADDANKRLFGWDRVATQILYSIQWKKASIFVIYKL